MGLSDGNKRKVNKWDKMFFIYYFVKQKYYSTIARIKFFLPCNHAHNIGYLGIDANLNYIDSNTISNWTVMIGLFKDSQRLIIESDNPLSILAFFV